MDITMNVFDVRQIHYIARIVISGICGIFIGLERKNRSKEAVTFGDVPVFAH